MIFSKLNFRSPILSFALLPNVYRDLTGYDKVNKNEEDSADEDSAWKRLKKMYSLDNRGIPSPQFESISDAVMTSFFIGFIGGALLDSRETYLNFIETNKTTAFKSHFEAKRKIQDVMLLSLFRGGWRRGWRISLITGSIITLLFSLEASKGYTSITDFTIATAIPCGLYNFPRGPKPFISGLFVGGGLGTIAGIFAVALFKLTGTSLQSIYKFDSNRLDKALEKEHDTRLKLREKEFTGVLAYRRGTSLLIDDDDDDDDVQHKAQSENVVEAKLGNSDKREIEIERISMEKTEEKGDLSSKRSLSVSTVGLQDKDESGNTEDKIVSSNK